MKILQNVCNKSATIMRTKGAACFSVGITDEQLYLRTISLPFRLSSTVPPFSLQDVNSPLGVAAHQAMEEKVCICTSNAFNLGSLVIPAGSLVVPVLWRRQSTDAADEVIERPIGIMLFWEPKNGMAIPKEDEGLAITFGRQIAAVLVEERLIEVSEMATSFASVPVGIVLIDENNRVLLINPMAHDFLCENGNQECSLETIDREGQLSKLTEAARATSDGRSACTVTINGGISVYATAQIARNKQCVIALNRTQVSGAAEQLIGQVAHELRTPLTIIQAALITIDSLLEGEYSADDVTLCKEYIETGTTQCDRMTRLISETLNLSRIHAGRDIEINYRRFDIIKSMKSLLAELADATFRHCLELDIPETCEIVADEDKVISIMDNLVKNAVKYSEPGKTVHFSIHADENNVVICVKDEGIGIPPEDIERVGRDPGYRTEHSRKHAGGIGLGLMYVRRVVETHGGSLHIHSVLGEGSTFTVTLPRSHDKWDDTFHV